jgi:DNA-binding transcriptional LysR family regulator
LAVFEQCLSSVDGHDDQIGLKLRSIDFVSIRLIAECAERGSLVAAANQCHISVGAASRRLSILEDLLGHQIFQRIPRGLKATSEGLHVVAACHKLLKRLDDLSQMTWQFAASTSALSKAFNMKDSFQES